MVCNRSIVRSSRFRESFRYIHMKKNGWYRNHGMISFATKNNLLICIFSQSSKTKQNSCLFLIWPQQTDNRHLPPTRLKNILYTSPPRRVFAVLAQFSKLFFHKVIACAKNASSSRISDPRNEPSVSLSYTDLEWLSIWQWPPRDPFFLHFGSEFWILGCFHLMLYL